MRPLKDRVAIIVQGGVVQEVICDHPHEVILVDYDNIEQGGDLCPYPASVGGKALDRALREARSAVRQHQRRLPKQGGVSTR